MFNAETYTHRREKLRSLVSSGIILLMGNEESSMNFADNTYPYRQDSTFLYYFGLNHAGLTGIIDIDEGTDYIFGDDLTIDHIVWMGYQPTVADRAALAGVSRTGSDKDLGKFLEKARSGNRKVHILPPYRPENRIRLSRWLQVGLDDVGRTGSVELIKAVVSMREIKSEEEIAEMEKAVDTSVDMHVAAMKMAVPGIRESEIAARVQEIAVAAGGGLAFPVIATVHGETLHNHYHGNRLEEGQIFLLDCGAETSMGYAGDLSSTVPVGSRLSERQSRIYELTLKAHECAVESLKPGISFKEVYYKSAGVIVEGLKEMNLMKGDVDKALESGAHAMFFPCGLGHQIGLDVHDMEDLGEVYVGYDGEPKSTQFGLKSLRLGKELKRGMTLTIEPGIYFIPQLMDLWREQGKHTDYINYGELEKWRDFGGIRNEENFLITGKGYRLLGKKKPKTLEEIYRTRQ